MKQHLNKLQRLAVLDGLIARGDAISHHLYSPGLRRTSDSAAQAAEWICAVQQVLSHLGASPQWCIWNERRPLSHLSFEQALQGLFVLRWRIVDGRSDSIDGDAQDKLRVATMLVSFGEYIIHVATENQSGVPLEILLAFDPWQREELGPALLMIHGWSKLDAAHGVAWEPSLQLIGAKKHAGMSLLSVGRGLQWRLARLGNLHVRLAASRIDG